VSPHKYSGMLVRDILLRKKASVRSAPLPPGTPPWDEVAGMTWEQVDDAAVQNQVGFKTIRKLLTDSRFDK
jgi:hypothetical protein